MPNPVRLSDRPLAVSALAHRAGVVLLGPCGECLSLTPAAARATLKQLEAATALAEQQAADQDNVVQGRFQRVRSFAVWRQQRLRHEGADTGQRLIVTALLGPVTISALVVLIAVLGQHFLGGDTLREWLVPILVLASVAGIALVWLAAPALLARIGLGNRPDFQRKLHLV